MKRALITAAAAAIALAGLPLASPASAAVQTTTITMNVTGCEGCTIVPATTPAGSSEIYNGPRTKVKNGVATIVVPTAMTAGMYFGIEAAWKSDINAQPLIVFQYKGAKPGSTVTRAQALSFKKASACWSGTSTSSATIDVRVGRVLMPAFPPSGHAKTSVPLAWVVPTEASSAPFWPVIKGVLAVQDSVDCSVS